MKNKSFALDKGTNFLKAWMIILTALSFVYILIHVGNNNGGIRRQLTNTDITILNSLNDTPAIFKSEAYQYLNHKYPLLNSSREEMAAILGTYSKKNSVAILTQIGLVNTSFFWLKNDLALIEVMFWALFGTICSFLYYFVENYKKGTLDKKEYPSYFSKLFYTPFVVLILYIAPNLFSDNGINSHFDYWSIVIGFILGFFSGRAIELLDRLKNLVFPYKSSDDTPGSITSTIPEEVYIEALKENAGTWSDKYGPLNGISVARKMTGGDDTGIFSLQFHVPLKETPQDDSKTIPPLIPFNYQGKDYDLVTDVVSAGEPKGNLCYEPTSNNFIGSELAPKFLGLSCSRAGTKAFGTIGFKAQSRDVNDNKSYLVSCYHVLCSNELAQKSTKVDEAGNNLVIVSPETGQAGEAPLAYVRKAEMNESIDAGYAELITSDNLNNVIYGPFLSPKIILILTKEHVDMKYQVLLAGRTSCIQTGYVLSHYTDITVSYYNGPTVVATQSFKGIIKTCKISTFGDSGAPVVDTKGNAIGILFASDNEYSYIIPLLSIFNYFNLTFSK